jgi:hypothetical protein
LFPFKNTSLTIPNIPFFSLSKFVYAAPDLKVYTGATPFKYILSYLFDHKPFNNLTFWDTLPRKLF